MSISEAPQPGTRIELGSGPTGTLCNQLVTVNSFTVTLVGTQLQVYVEVTPNNPDDSLVVLTVSAGDGKGKTYAGANFAAGGQGGLPGEMVSVLAFSDLYDGAMTGNTVVASYQGYLLTSSGGCWIYNTQTVGV